MLSENHGIWPGTGQCNDASYLQGFTGASTSRSPTGEFRSQLGKRAGLNPAPTRSVLRDKLLRERCSYSSPRLKESLLKGFSAPAEIAFFGPTKQPWATP